MGMYLNPKSPFEACRAMVSTRFFVDKTRLICDILESLEMDGQRYLCFTRPRRFGKTVMANMVGAFFEKGVDSSEMFDRLEIGRSKYYKKYRNSRNVIYIDFSQIPKDCRNYHQYIERIQDGLVEDLASLYPEFSIRRSHSAWDVLTEIFEKTNHRFIFVIDEWDAVFHMPFMTDNDTEQYVLFLRSLLKSKEYVELVYMTGILPIAKYSDGSELNMFDEYTMAGSERYSGYFGFLDGEVDHLYQIYQDTARNPKITREDLSQWYDGYVTASGSRLYNPRSIVSALRDNQLGSYWTNSGTYDPIFRYMKENVEGVQDDLVIMVSGGRIEARIQEYAATAKELNTKDQIYSAMVVYGLLTYEDGEVFIPNRELMKKFDELLLEHESLGYVNRLAKESSKMLKATLSGDTKTMADILKYVHDTESPIFSYNNEIELSAVVNLVYLAARDKYRVEREDKAGEGYVDFIFYPHRKGADAIILELKVGASAEEAIRQIKDRKYMLRFKGKLGEEERYTGRILAVGIAYDKKTKEHFCKVGVLQ